MRYQDLGYSQDEIEQLERTCRDWDMRNLSSREMFYYRMMAPLTSVATKPESESYELAWAVKDFITLDEILKRYPKLALPEWFQPKRQEHK